MKRPFSSLYQTTNYLLAKQNKTFVVNEETIKTNFAKINRKPEQTVSSELSQKDLSNHFDHRNTRVERRVESV